MSTSRPKLVASRASVTAPDDVIAPTPEPLLLEEGSDHHSISIENVDHDATDEGMRGDDSDHGDGDVSSPGSRVTSAKESPSSPVVVRQVDSAVGFDTDLEIDEEKDDFDLSGVKVYAETCKELGVVPASYFMRHMKGSHLAMRHHGLGPLGAKAIAIPLVSNTIVHTLDLEDNWIESGGAIYISDMLKENCYITHLNLSNNNIGTAAAKSICEMLLINATLSHINLSGNGFQDKDGSLFAQVILENSNIQHLNLSHNSFGDQSGDELGHAIGENETLESLDLSWNNFRRDSGVKILDGIQVNSRLKRVQLCMNGFGPEGANAISNCLKNNSILVELDVSSTRIVPEGAALIAKGLEANESLKVLRIGKNLFGAKGAFMILSSIHNERSVLTELDMTEVWVEKEFAELYQEILQGRPDLIVKHGGIVGNYVITGMYVKSRDGETDLERFLRTNTWAVIRAHLDASGQSIADVFSKFDKTGSGRISAAHFTKAIEAQNIQLTNEQMTTLQERLQALTNVTDNTVNYREIIEGSSGQPQQ